jgi:hypothetical protein
VCVCVRVCVCVCVCVCVTAPTSLKQCVLLARASGGVPATWCGDDVNGNLWSMCVTAPNRFEQCAPLVRVFDGRCIFHSVTDNMIDDVFDHSRKAPKHESCLRVT